MDIINSSPKRAINFDLDTKQMESVLGDKTSGYSLLKKSLNKLGFEHRQGSGYISKQPIDNIQLFDIISKVAEQNPWLLSCVNRIDVTDIGQTFDIIPLIELTMNQSKDESRREKTASAKDAISQGSGKTIPKQTATSKTTPSKAHNPSLTQSKQKTIKKSIGKGLGL